MRVNFKEFLRNLESSKADFYLLTGPEEYPKIRARDRLLSQPRFQGLQRTLLMGPQVSAQDLFDKFSQPGLFGSGEVVVVQMVHKLSAAVKKTLLELLENEKEYPGRPVFVFLADNDRLDATDPLESYAMSHPRAVHVFFPVLSEEEVLGWARAELKRRGLEASEADLRRVAYVYANDLYAWANFIKSLDIALSGGKREMKVPPEQITALLASAVPQEEAAWKTLEESMLVMLSKTLRKGELLAAFKNYTAAAAATAESCAMNLLQLAGERIYELACLKTGLEPSRSFRWCSHGPRLRQAAPRWSWEEVKAFYRTLLDCERKIKTGELPAETAAMECLNQLSDICGRQ